MKFEFTVKSSVLAVVAATCLVGAAISSEYRFAPASDCFSSVNASSHNDLSFASLSKALQDHRPARILVVGSSSTVGIGASSSAATYVALLPAALSKAVEGAEFKVIPRGISGEVAQGAADRMKREVEEAKPDLVLWQVGTNDALSHISLDRFANCLAKTLAWIKSQNIDVALINPQYGELLVKDSFYGQVVAAVGKAAEAANVPVIDRFHGMEGVHASNRDDTFLSKDNLHMNDRGYRCLADQITAVVAAGVTQFGPKTSVKSRLAEQRNVDGS